MRQRLTFLAGALALAVAGCNDPADLSKDWDYVHATIVEPSCATIGCHSEATKIAGLNLADRDIACDAFRGYPPAFIDQLLRGQADDDEYPQMPPDLRLADPEIELIARWYEEGTCD